MINPVLVKIIVMRTLYLIQLYAFEFVALKLLSWF